LDLEHLKDLNSEDTQEMNRSYPPENHWIPKGQWASMVRLLTKNLTLLPEILESMDALATEESMRRYYQATKQSLEEIAREQRSQQREISSRVGKMSDESSKRGRELERSLTNWQEQFQKKTWKRLIILIGAQTIILTVLMILLLMILK